MGGKGVETHRLGLSESVTVEDRWDPFLYRIDFVIDSGSFTFEHFFEVPPFFFRNAVREGNHHIVLPPGYNKLTFFSKSSRSVLRYRAAE